MSTVSSPKPTVYCDTAHAWLLGHSLGLHTELSEPPAGYTEAEAEAFRSGWTVGESNRRLTRGWPDCLRPADEVGAFLAELHGDDHDAQPDPFDVETNTVSELEWDEFSRGFVSYPDDELVRILGHRSAEIGGDL